MSVESIASVAGAESIAALDPAQTAAEGFGTGAAASVQSNDFSQMVSRGLDEVNTQLMSTQTDLQQLAVGDVQNLHQVMIHMEEARMSFQLLMQVRNRVLETYQELMRMPV